MKRCRLSQEEFIRRANNKHSDKYDYSKTVFIKSHEKVVVTCPIHGDFQITPAKHVLRSQGCPTCGKLKSAESRQNSLTEILDRFVKVHGSTYDYSKVIYTGYDNLVTIVCPFHGEFKQSPNNHLSGKGCAKCIKYSPKNLNYFLEKAREVHGNKYDYSQSIYVKAVDKIDIICPIHGLFSQQANLHLLGSGCPECSSAYGFRKSTFINFCHNKGVKPILYILFCKDSEEKFFKIGITSRSIEKRYKVKKSLPYPYKKLYIIQDNPDVIYELEKTLVNLLSDYKYSPTVPFGGSSKECFIGSKEVYKLIKEKLHVI